MIWNRRVVTSMVVSVALVTAGVAAWILSRSGGVEATRHELRPADLEAAAHLATPLPTTDAPAPPSPEEADDGCDVVLSPDVATIEGSDVAPGTVVCLEGRRGPLHLHDVHGTAADPVVVVNRGTVVIEGDEDDYAGIDLTSSSHVRISGSSESGLCGASVARDAQECGIVIRGTGRGVAGTEATTNVTVDHVEITGTTHSGVFMRTEVEEGFDRSEFTQFDTVVRSAFIHGVGREGIYLGSSSYRGGEDPLLRGVSVVDNLVVQTAWDGIQVGSAVEDCAIRGNIVVLAGLENDSDQNAGIINNHGSVCDIHHNLVVSSAAQGIFVQGNGGNRVYANVVVGSGVLEPGEGDGIIVTSGTNEDVPIHVVHNTIVGSTRSGIHYRNQAGSGNAIVNNLIVGPDMQAGPIVVGAAVDVLVEGNLAFDDVAEAGFSAPDRGDFRLTPSSPAVDAGVVSEYATGPDFVGTPRPQRALPDAGAFELRESG